MWGFPFLRAVLYAHVPCSSASSAPARWWRLLEDGSSALSQPAGRRAAAVLPWAVALRDLLVGPYGLVTMALTYALALVLPIVATFFLAFGVLEDSGYLPRLAVMVNRTFRAMG